MEPRIAVRVKGQARNSSEFTRHAMLTNDTCDSPLSVLQRMVSLLAAISASLLRSTFAVIRGKEFLIIFGFTSCFTVCHRHNL